MNKVYVPFNVNHMVKVRLTDAGRAKIANDPDGPYPYSTDEDGWSEFQLWVLMELFGRHMYNGVVDVPFETTIQLVIDEQQ